MVDRISDDSGLTSDDTWEKKADLMTKSASELHKSASLRYPKKPSIYRAIYSYIIIYFNYKSIF